MLRREELANHQPIGFDVDSYFHPHRRFTIATWFSSVHRVRRKRTEIPCVCICIFVYICEWVVKVLPDQPIGARSSTGQIKLILCIYSRVARITICEMESRERNVLCVGVDFRCILGRLYHRRVYDTLDKLFVR